MTDELTGSLNDRATASNASEVCSNLLTNIRLLPHPMTCLAHIAFKVAILSRYFIMPYVFGSMTGAYPDFILTFELIGVLAFADFWVVKNCTSSTLAGISWYCDSTVANADTFVHKRVKDEMFLNKEESAFFWAVMYIWPALWVLNVAALISTFDIPWVGVKVWYTHNIMQLVASGVIVTFALINLVNCLKCSQDKREKASKLTGKLADKLMGFITRSYIRSQTIPN
ncbi:-Golgi apparatus membrane protein tvp23 [Babesia bigemina]|uniref:Golgi apparatus membrane protein TVP23 homolog n=1 Tax=Babesia bigemina TaxID=5866 RepID=A0A061DCM3_BABBI|nr:-Golgi apparatus membrane protein tvp23 [Babesia bigemina]CDR97872.1 -Golgi apparatus membrane protein tvp23 [Babesia bigemina]|eukprot:XP_012770058.1 -Golgi apparatus membrane protein tvp23 [Babesia bigemina]